MPRRPARPNHPFFSVRLGDDALPTGVDVHPEHIAAFATEQAGEAIDMAVARVKRDLTRRAGAISVPVVAAVSAAAGVAAYGMYTKARGRKRKPTASGSKPDKKSEQAMIPPSGDLIRGQTYALQIAIDPAASAWGHVSDMKLAASILRRSFEKLGWESPSGTNPPQPRDKENASAFLAGEPSEWVWSATWEGDVRGSSSPPWAETKTYLLSESEP